MKTIYNKEKFGKALTYTKNENQEFKYYPDGHSFVLSRFGTLMTIECFYNKKRSHIVADGFDRAGIMKIWRSI
jgi:hypothetical protein